MPSISSNRILLDKRRPFLQPSNLLANPMSTLYPSYRSDDSDDSVKTKTAKPAPAKPFKSVSTNPITYKPTVTPPWANATDAAMAIAKERAVTDITLRYGSPATPLLVPPSFIMEHPHPAIMVAPVAPPPAPVVPKMPSLKAFLATDTEIEGSDWTTERIAQALGEQLWRVREVGETVREGDIMSVEYEGIRYERVSGWKDMVITQENVDLHGFVIWTLEGGGKPRKPIVIRSTTEFAGLMSVPKGCQLRLPTDESEAKRFFGCDVVIGEVVEKGRPVKCFYPIPNRMGDRVFRQAFSRVFPDFAKRHFRDYIKGLIPGRGDGIRLKRGLSLKKLVRLSQMPYRKGDTHTPMTAEQLAMKVNLPVETITQLLAKQDYRKVIGPIIPFKERMDMRQLNPTEFKYDKALGIEIETVTPYSHEAARKRVPSYVRCEQDGSIRANVEKDQKPDNVKNWGIEYRILIKRSEMETRILDTVRAISAMGATVNKSCGLHVHFDMRDKTKTEVTGIHDRLTKWLGSMRELLPPSRRENKYCAFENADSNHHWAVNLSAYDKHKTLEVRVHSATLNHIKIIQWIRLCEAIIATKFIPPAKPSTLDALKMLGLTEADRTYWLKRHQQLNPGLYKGGSLDLSFLGDKPDENE